MRPNKKKVIMYGTVLLFAFYFFGKLSQAVRLSLGEDFATKFMGISSGLAAAFSDILPSFNGTDMLIGICGALAILMLIVVKRQNNKQFRQGIEYGSARWGAYYQL